MSPKRSPLLVRFSDDEKRFLESSALEGSAGSGRYISQAGYVRALVRWAMVDSGRYRYVVNESGKVVDIEPV